MDSHVIEYCTICARKKKVKVLAYHAKDDFLSAYCEACRMHYTFKNYKASKQRTLF
jgi:hypothetical protein